MNRYIVVGPSGYSLAGLDADSAEDAASKYSLSREFDGELTVLDVSKGERFRVQRTAILFSVDTSNEKENERENEGK